MTSEQTQSVGRPRHLEIGVTHLDFGFVLGSVAAVEVKLDAAARLHALALGPADSKAQSGLVGRQIELVVVAVARFIVDPYDVVARSRSRVVVGRVALDEPVELDVQIRPHGFLGRTLALSTGRRSQFLDLFLQVLDPVLQLRVLVGQTRTSLGPDGGTDHGCDERHCDYHLSRHSKLPDCVKRTHRAKRDTTSKRIQSRLCWIGGFCRRVYSV
jgi:hypothetical protein